MPCVCGHSVASHDSGGCCREPFCPCWKLRPVEALPVLTATPAVSQPTVNPLGNFAIESASYADLAKWAYKARDFIRAHAELEAIGKRG